LKCFLSETAKIGGGKGMREILFRGKHIHALPQNKHLDGTWVYGYLRDENYINTCEEDEYGGKFTSEVLVDPETVCQYTGLTDKNGKKIFEGDIVREEDDFDENESYMHIIQYSDDYKTFTTNIQICSSLDEPLSEYLHLELCEVVGNIFDNPELIGD